MSDAPISVLIVDDHFVARAGLRAIIEGERDMTLLAEASSFTEALAMHRRYEPDVTLMDVSLPDGDGIDAIAAILSRDEDAAFVVLTSVGGDEPIRRALALGVQGYLFKDMVRTQLTAAIRAVRQGHRYLPLEVSELIVDYGRAPVLSDREKAVLNQVAKGQSNKVIARELGITENTVKAHLQAIFTKIDANDRAHAVVIAMKRGLLSI